MRLFFSIVLIILVMLMGFQHAIIVAHFKLNRPSITRDYCINKDTPAMGCKGLCHLKRQLNKKDQSDSKSISYPKADLLITPCLEYGSSHLVFAIYMTFAYKETTYDEPPAEIFIPPPIPFSNASE